MPRGEVSEWLKEHAWKVCKSKGFEGSNPSLTAILNYCFYLTNTVFGMFCEILRHKFFYDVVIRFKHVLILVAITIQIC